MFGEGQDNNHLLDFIVIFGFSINPLAMPNLMDKSIDSHETGFSLLSIKTSHFKPGKLVFKCPEKNQRQILKNENC